ncbi:MAG: hypothetical protein KY432_00755 [Acidobacteria bacterium]|nr:hypothetical protein [Acidobacteriota bacterium]
MTSPDTNVLQQRLVRVITRRIGSSTGAGAVAVAARLTHGDLTAALDPLISSSGVEALWRRAFDLAQREYPAGERRDEDGRTDESFAQVTRWLEAQVPSAATDAAAAFYTALGWQRWQGPTFALTPTGIARTADEDGSIYVLEVGEPLDLAGGLTCDWRDGDPW